MAKKGETGGMVSPANLWGKPLPRIPGKPTATEEGKATRMLPDEDEIDSDVDAELAEEEPTEDELLDEESVDDADEVSTVEASGDDDDDDDDDADEDEEFEAEEGDEEDDAEASAVADDGEVDSTVDVDEVPVKAEKANTPTRVTKKMAEKKSISDHVREEITARKAAGESLRGVDIVNALAKRRIKVSPAQVSQLLKKAGVSQKARGPRKAVAVAATEERSRAALKTKKTESPRQAPKVRATTSTTTELPWKQLNAAKAFIAACDGSFEAASDALAMFHKIENVLHN